MTNEEIYNQLFIKTPRQVLNELNLQRTKENYQWLHDVFEEEDHKVIEKLNLNKNAGEKDSNNLIQMVSHSSNKAHSIKKTIMDEIILMKQT